MPNWCPQSWRVRRIFPLFLLGMAMVAPSLPAQETNPPAQEAAAPAQQTAPPAQETAAPGQEAAAPHPGAYSFSGVASFGYRFVDVNGSRAKYDQLLNLQEGFRLFDGQIDVTPTEPGHGWFDRLSLSFQGLGGDPFPVIRADLRKNGLYDLRVSYRATQYFYDLPQPITAPNHGWIDRRRFADLDFRYTPSRNLRVRFFYNRTERVGNDLATSFSFVPLGPSIWEALGGPGSIPWVIPLHEEADLFGGGIDYRLGKTDFHIEQSYRTYNSPANLQGIGNQSFLGPGLQPLVFSRWDSFAGLDMPITSFRVNREVFDRLELRGGYIFTHATGPTSLNGTISQPNVFVLNYVGAGKTNMTTQTVEAGFTLKVLESMDLITDYRYQNFSETSRQSIQAFRSDFPNPFPLDHNTLGWDFGIHTVDALVTFTPRTSLSIRAGVRILNEDIVRRENGKVAALGTQSTLTYTPLINIAWTPSKKFSLRGNFESRVAVDPYVRISPENTVGANIRTRFSLSEHWGIDNTWSFRNLKTEDINFVAHSRTNSTSLWYQPMDKLGFQGGFNYGNFSSRNTIGFLAGVPPLTGLLSTDQTIDRTYFLGFKVNPKGSLTIAFTGQYIRSTGAAAYTGATTVYGPLTWPAWSAEIGYTAKHLGRTVLAWQRSYYHENLFRLTDYSANSFVLRFERSF